MTIMASIVTWNVTFASSSPTATMMQMEPVFGVSAEVSYLVTTVFLLGYTFGPIVWGPGSEVVGRRPVFVLALSLYTLFILGQPLAKNMETLLITRFLSAFFASAPLTNCGGMIADIWDPIGRGPATGLFTACVFLGPVCGPIVSAAIMQSGVSWHWVYWVMMIFAGVVTVMMIVFFEETYAPVILAKKARKIRKANPESKVMAEHEDQDWDLKHLAKRTIYRPFHMLAIEPILLLSTIYLSLVYGVLYALFQAIPIVFIRVRGFTLFQSSLIFIGVGIGTTLGALIFFLTSRHYPTLLPKWRGFPPPEQRLFGAMIGGPLMVIGCFWLGWSGHYASVHWAVPAVSVVFIGMSVSLVFMSFLTYLVETYLMYAASALAANAMTRSLVASCFPLFTTQMFTKLGVNWAATLFGCIALVLAPSPFLFYKYGARIRGLSSFAPCLDLKIAKELKAEEEAGKVGSNQA